MARKYNATPQEINFYENDLEIEETPQGLEVADQSFSFYEDPTNPAQTLPEQLPWYRSIPNAIGKAAVNGLVGFGKAFGPLPEDNTALLQEYLQQRGSGGQENDQISFQEYVSQNKPQSVGDFLNQQLPTNEGFLENTIARAGDILPFLLTGGIGGAAGAESRVAGSALAEGMGLTSGALKDVLLQRAKDVIGPIGRSLAGGAGGATAESYGAPEWVQSLAEIPGQIGPGFGSRLQPNKSQSDLVAQARKLGLSDKEITPLIQNPTKANALGLFSEKRLKTPTTLKNSYDAVDRTYNGLSARPEAKKVLNDFQFQRLGTDIQEKLKEMPAGVREIITTDLQDLLNSDKSGKAIMNFYRDVNHYIYNPNLNASQLGLLKGPVTTALSQLSPELARDFNTTNKLFKGYKNIASKLSPTTSSDMLQAGKIGFLMHGVATGNFPEIASVIGTQAATMMTSELLLNPRFQNYSQQLINALNKNQVSVQKKVLELMVQLAREKSPEMAVYLQQLIPLSKQQSNREIEESTQ